LRIRRTIKGKNENLKFLTFQRKKNPKVNFSSAKDTTTILETQITSTAEAESAWEVKVQKLETNEPEIISKETSHLTVEQKKLIDQTWNVLQDDPTALQSFYDILFKTHPDIRKFFEGK
jgi:hypothetical protein